MSKKITILGSGFSSLSASCLSSKSWIRCNDFTRKMNLLGAELDSFAMKVSHSTWGQHGTGCQMYLKSFLTISIKKLLITTNYAN